ncbi:MAG TPA: acetamidase/formamidase family protein [Candidatus Sulfotelmatobacter sp.]|jgi:amidase|nr:acetamidase/formamidase family protein [Candidatus Sulfotelmatobacter sp.]
MRKLTLVVCLLSSLCLIQNSSAQDSKGPLSGRWLVTADFKGTPLYFRLNLEQQGAKLVGDFDGDKLEGSVSGNAVRFLAKDDHGGSEDVKATLSGNSMSGTVIFIYGDNPDHPDAHEFTATLVPARPTGPAMRHEFVPTTFYRQFSPHNKPVLTIAPGDSVHTTTVDAGGTDEKGVARVLGGNPETGPFYVETAVPGDTLVVHIIRLRLNRDWAMSDDYIVDRGMDRDMAVKAKDDGKNVRWHLDTAKGAASPEKPGEHLTHYSVPLRPMLGCVATAPGPAQAPPGTGDSGHYGGNMDFNEVIEGATVYLPFSNPGALLYVGDGHALQGDGELNGNALETSMDVEFSVDIIPAKRIGAPRVESATHIMVVGLAGSLDEAFRIATANMAQWLTEDYKLTSSEVAQVLGTSSEYKVSEVADRNAGIVLKINKERLASLAPAPK